MSNFIKVSPTSSPHVVDQPSVNSTNSKSNDNKSNTNLQNETASTYCINSILSKNQQLTLLYLLLEDDDHQLRQLQDQFSHEQWLHLLLSSDSCSNSNEVCGADAMLSNRSHHAAPSNPFLLAIHFGAEKCMQLMLNSCTVNSDERLRVLQVTEDGLNALHTLCYALHIGTVQAPSCEQAIGKDKTRDKELAVFLYKFLFELVPKQQLLLWSDATADNGLTPIEYLAYLGEPRLVELMLYLLPRYSTESKVHRAYEHEVLDLSLYSSCYGNTIADSRFFMSPLMLLIDSCNAAQMRASNAWRSAFILNAWLQLLWQRNAWIAFSYGAAQIVAFSLLLWTSETAVKSIARLQTAQCQREPHEQPLISTLATAVTLLPAGSTFVLIVNFLISRKLQFNRSGITASCGGLSGETRKLLLGSSLNTLTALALCILQMTAVHLCQQGFDATILSAILTIILALQSLYCILLNLRYFPLIGGFITALVECFTTFFLFVMFYAVLLIVFARLLATSHDFSSSSSSSSSNATVEKLPAAIWQSYYTFLITLNILNSTEFVPIQDNSPLLLMHFMLILLLPVFVINFIVSLLSMELSQYADQAVEHQVAMKVRLLPVIELLMHRPRRWLQQCFKVRNDELLVRICLPIGPGSKSQIMQQQQQ